MARASDVTRMRAFMYEGYSDERVQEETGWSRKRIPELRKEVLAQEEVRIVGRRDEEVYTEHVIAVQAMIGELDELIAEVKGSKQPSAAVGAIKAKAGLREKVIKMGQEMGFIRKAPRELRITHVDDRELKAELIRRLRQMHGNMARYGDKTLAEVEIIDVTPEPKALPALRANPESDADTEPVRKPILRRRGRRGKHRKEAQRANPRGGNA